MALARKKHLSELRLYSEIPQQHYYDAVHIMLMLLFSGDLPSRYSRQWWSILLLGFSERETMIFADRGWHCCTVAPQPSIQDVSIYKKGLVFTRKGADKPDALLQDFLEIVLHKISNLGYQEFYILIKPPKECVSMYRNWMSALVIV